MREQGVKLVWDWALEEGRGEWYSMLSGAEEMMQGGEDERQE